MSSEADPGEGLRGLQPPFEQHFFFVIEGKIGNIIFWGEGHGSGPLKAGLNLKFDQNVDIFLFFKSYAAGTEECYGKCFRVKFALLRCWRIVLFSAVEKQFRLPW